MVDTHNPWTTLATHRVYDGGWLALEDRRVRDPAGHDAPYAVVLFKKQGLQICDVRHTAEFGGTLHAWIRRGGSASAAVQQMLEDEDRWGVDRLGTYQNWANRLERVRMAAVPFNPVAIPTSLSPAIGAAV